MEYPYCVNVKWHPGMLAEKKKILVVDDEVELCALLKNFLVKRNYDVSVCYTIEECRQMLNTTSFDFVFLDNNLPDGVGWDMVSTIAEKKLQTFIMLISAYKAPQFKIPGFTNYKIMEKPLRFADIERDLKEILG